MNDGPGLSVGDIDGTAGAEGRGKQDSAQKATTATTVSTVDPKPIPKKHAAQTGKQAIRKPDTKAKK
jgi:Mn-containing catalase